MQFNRHFVVLWVKDIEEEFKNLYTSRYNKRTHIQTRIGIAYAVGIYFILTIALKFIMFTIKFYQSNCWISSFFSYKSCTAKIKAIDMTTCFIHTSQYFIIFTYQFTFVSCAYKWSIYRYLIVLFFVYMIYMRKLWYPWSGWWIWSPTM